MKFVLNIIIILIAISCGDKNKSSDTTASTGVGVAGAQSLCGNFTKNHDTVFLIDSKGSAFALQPTNQAVDDLIWDTYIGQSGCAHFNQPIAAEHGWYGINGITNVIYVNSVSR